MWRDHSRSANTICPPPKLSFGAGLTRSTPERELQRIRSGSHGLRVVGRFPIPEGKLRLRASLKTARKRKSTRKESSVLQRMMRCRLTEQWKPCREPIAFHSFGTDYQIRQPRLRPMSGRRDGKEGSNLTE